MTGRRQCKSRRRRDYGDIVRTLLDTKADLSSEASDAAGALFKASANGHLDVVQALLGARADVNAKVGNGVAALLGPSTAITRSGGFAAEGRGRCEQQDRERGDGSDYGVPGRPRRTGAETARRQGGCEREIEHRRHRHCIWRRRRAMWRWCRRCWECGASM